MKIAIIGSRNISIDNFNAYVSHGDEIVSGGARGVDLCAEAYARNNGMKFTLFKPEYARYGRAAPIIRNRKIVEYADKILAFWDGESRGTLSVIEYAKKCGKPCEIVIVKKQNK